MARIIRRKAFSNLQPTARQAPPQRNTDRRTSVMPPRDPVPVRCGSSIGRALRLHHPTRKGVCPFHFFQQKSLPIRNIHFTSGLRRANATMLSSIMRHDTDFYAAMSSPMGTFFNTCFTAMGPRMNSPSVLRSTTTVTS